MNYLTWGANINGGYLRSKIPQETSNDVPYNIELAQLADNLGMEGILYPIRYVGRIGGSNNTDGQFDPLTLISAMATHTSRIHFLAAILPAFIHPVTLAKAGATIDHISNGRFHINLVSGWFKSEQEAFGIDWIKHQERYRRSDEFLQVVKGLWTEDNFSFDGKFYKIQDASLHPKPLQKPYPAVYQGGNSTSSQQVAAKYADVYFMNGAPIEELKPQIDAVTKLAAEKNRTLSFAVAAYVIARETEEEALTEYEEILKHADEASIAQFQKSKETQGMWKNAKTISDFVANNEGFRTGLIGSYEQVTEKILELESIGVSKILLALRYPIKELPLFFEHVVPKTVSFTFNTNETL
ncbi:LLM class flavin-dependent oxidoreductase [Oceanobacillus piezotolerans]|uniref:LLM class flavin-dependent oxidoreductase n=1 Tax=Oceanobacillus piezotolerans TaxID=2448030 RepID=A0A498D8L5_9BACI|nr:LLM class flavin-dependent oxidoreductase [Oceanobacillus piezotolerans]RLL47055.1 LLM class flavin-dependent oxidoreductase [Oceanobacillus piezotolerans]